MTVLIQHVGAEVRARSEWRHRGAVRSQSRRRRSASPRVGRYRLGVVAERKALTSKAEEEIDRYGVQLAGGLVSGMLEDCADEETDDCIVDSDCSLSDSEEASEAESDVEDCCSEFSCGLPVSAPTCYDEAAVSIYASPAKSKPTCFYVTKFKDVVSAQYLLSNDTDGSAPDAAEFKSGVVNVAEEVSLPTAASGTIEVCETDNMVKATKVPLEEQVLQMLRMLPQRPPVLPVESFDVSAELLDDKFSVYDDDGQVDGRVEHWDSEGEMLLEESEDEAADVRAEFDAIHCLNFATRMAHVAVSAGLIDVMESEDAEDQEFDSDDDCEEAPLATLVPLAPLAPLAGADCVDNALYDKARSGSLQWALSEGTLCDVSALNEAAPEKAAPEKVHDPLESAMRCMETVLVRSLDDGNLGQAMFQMMENREIARGMAEFSELALQTRNRAEALASLLHGATPDAEPSECAAQGANEEPTPAAPNTPGFSEAFSADSLGQVFTELAMVLDARSARWFMQEIYTSILDLGMHVEAPVFDVTIEIVETQIEQPCDVIAAPMEDLSEQLPSPARSKHAPIVRNVVEEEDHEDLAPFSSPAATPAPRLSSRVRRTDPTKRLSVAKEDDFSNSAHDITRSQSGSKLRGSLPAGSPAASLRKHRHAMRDAGKEAAIAFAMDAADVLDTAPLNEVVRDCSITRGYEALGVQFHSLDSGEEVSPPVSRASSRAGSAHKPRSLRHASKGDQSSSHTSKSERRACKPSGISSSSRALSAMELDTGPPAAPVCSAIAPKAPSLSSSSQMLRTASLGAVRLTKTRAGPAFLPMISSKSTSSLAQLPAASQRATSESFAWSGGSTRVRRSNYGSGF